MPPDIRPMMEQVFLRGLPSDAELEALQTKIAEINFVDAASFVFNISLPFIFITAILWFFYLPLFWPVVYKFGPFLGEPAHGKDEAPGRTGILLPRVRDNDYFVISLRRFFPVPPEIFLFPQ